MLIYLKNSVQVSLALFLMIGLMIGLSSCTNNQEGLSHFSSKLYPQDDVSAAKNIEQSFGVLPMSKAIDKNLRPNAFTGLFDRNEDLHLDHDRVQLNKAALEKEFLLQVSLIPQPSAAMSSGLKSRVVAFRRRADNIYLLEATAGHSVTHDLPQNLVLAEFNILSEDDNSIVIDFNKGMANLMVASEWRGSDSGAKQYDAATEFARVSLEFSYIESASLEKNHLVIRQVAQADVGSGVSIPVEVKYYLSPYQPTKEFEPTRTNSEFERLGFFEAAPLARNNQTEIIYATKFDKKNPIVFAISANTPEAYRQAIKDGILYWNQAFGYEALQVIDAPKGVTAPDLSYNVVQWVDFDNAGFAYADAQVDPRTGETLHAQVFFTSAFAVGSKRRAKSTIHQWDSQQETGHLKNHSVFGLMGFNTEPRCNFTQTENFVNSLRSLVNDQNNNDVDDAKILKVSQDYIREVAAHEVGHTLGLRHNFAGSLAANYQVSERSAINKSYYETGSVPEKLISSSSVMEYQLFEEATWTGDQIAKLKGSLPYDLSAIQNLYFGKTYEDSAIPFFCTDSHVGVFADCERFDIGRSYFETLKIFEVETPKSVALSLLNLFIAAKAPVVGEVVKSVKKVVLPSPQSLAVKFNTKNLGLIKGLTSSFKLLSIYRSYPIVDASNEASVQLSQLDYFQNELLANGGWSQLLRDDGRLLVSATQTAFKKLLEGQKKGIGFANQEYEFSDEELQWITYRIENLFEQTAKELIIFNTGLLGGNLLTSIGSVNLGVLTNHEISEQYAIFLLEKARDLIFAETGEKSFVEISLPSVAGAVPSKLRVALPTYKYPFSVRKAAAEFFKASRSKSVVWGVMQRKALLGEHRALAKAILTLDLGAIKAEDMPSMISAKWLQENQLIQTSMVNSAFL